MKCFYHSGDLDGVCSGAIVKKFFKEAQLIGIDYGQEFPWDIVRKGETVFMVDFSLQPVEEMRRLNDLSTLIWLDHHKSAITACHEAGLDGIMGTRDVTFAGCELAWFHCSSGLPLPRAVRMLGRYDVDPTDHADPDIGAFQFGMRTFPRNPQDEIWKLLLQWEGGNFVDAKIKEIMSWGSAIQRYKQVTTQEFVTENAFETEFDGQRVLVLNGGKGSETFAGHPRRVEFNLFLIFSRRSNKLWTISIYSFNPDVDCGAIAKKYGGGGHPVAAGFQCKELPFKI